MQFFAQDGNKKEVLAPQATKGDNYTCQECGGTLRVRQGPKRTSHFFHLAHATHRCHRQTSIEHHQTQEHVQKIFPGSFKEHPFLSIGRIADIFIPNLFLVIEIQCSPISTEEVSERTKDYHSQGMKVLWLLHTKNFNRFRASPAELFLQRFPHYYTDIDRKGHGKIFDQFSLIREGNRIFRSPPYRLNLAMMLPHSTLSFRKYWDFHFQGDLIDCPDEVEKLNKRVAPLLSKKRRWIKWIAKVYRTLFYLFLEKITRF